MEKGFFHADIGYWQTNSDVFLESAMAQYPEGTKEVPIKPDNGYTYDGTQWVPPSQQWLDDEMAKQVRVVRNTMLMRHVDTVAGNALRWQALTPEKQAEWALYRQALLDVPQQTGFPNDVVWPEMPQ